MFDLRKKVLNWVEPWVKIPVAGIDISDRSLKYLKFRPNSSKVLEFFGEIPIPEGVIVNGEIRRADDLVALLGSLLAREGRRLRSCGIVASLPEEKSYLHLVQFPKVERNKMATAIQLEIEANVPVPLEELVYDHEVVERPEDGGDHLDVIITAFPKQIVKSYVSVLKRVHLLPLALELESQATVRAVAPELNSRAAQIVVDLGRTRTGIVVIAEGAILFTKTVELGGKIFDENISRALQVSLEQAELIKKEVGLDRKAREGRVFSALLPACSVLASEIKRAMAFYQDRTEHLHGMGPAIDSVLLSGGDANIKGLATYFSSALRTRTILSDPFVNCGEKSARYITPLPKSQALALATVVGLALCGQISYQ